MSALDWIIVALTLLSAVAGYFQGFAVGAATLAGFGIGLFLGGRLGADLVAHGSHSPYAPVFALAGALIGGMVLGSLLEVLGYGVRRRLTAARLGILDGIGGALLAGAVALALAWLAGAVALQTPGARQFRDDIQRSAVLRALNGVLPPSGSILNALARFDPFPSIAGPPADVPPPRAAIAGDPQVRATTTSVVRIQGTAEINHQSGFTYTVDVADNGEPGTNDTFAITLSNGYSAGSIVSGGNIQLHNDCP